MVLGLCVLCRNEGWAAQGVDVLQGHPDTDRGAGTEAGEWKARKAPVAMNAGMDTGTALWGARSGWEPAQVRLRQRRHRHQVVWQGNQAHNSQAHGTRQWAGTGSRWLNREGNTVRGEKDWLR